MEKPTLDPESTSKTAIESLKTLCCKKVAPSKLIKLKNKYPDTVKLDAYDSTKTWPTEYIQNHRDNIVDLLLESLKDKNDCSSNVTTGKALTDRVMLIDNAHLKSYILTKVLTKERTIDQRKILACDLHPDFLFELSQIMNISFNHAVEEENELPQIHKNYLSNNKKILLNPTIWCQAYTPDCCKSRMSKTNEKFLKEELKTNDLNKYLVESRDQISAKLFEDVGSEKGRSGYCPVNNTYKTFYSYSTERKLAIAFSSALMSLLSQCETTEDFLNFSQQVLNLINRKVTNSEITIFLKNLSRSIKEDEPYTEKLEDICNVKDVILNVIKNFIRNSHFDSKKRLIEFIQELYEYRKTHCTLADIQKEKNLSLLNQLCKIVEEVV